MPRSRKRNHAFTLVEVAIACVIIGIAFAALMTMLNSGTRAQAVSSKTTDAIFLSESIREWTLLLPFTDPDSGDADNPPGPDGSDPVNFVDDLDDMKTVTFSPPRDGGGNTLSDMTKWSQAVTITWRDPTNPAVVVADGASDLVYVEVEVAHDDTPILTKGWLVANPGD